MTRIEALRAIAAGEVTDEVIAKVEEMIEAHETELAKRKERAAEKRAEKDKEYDEVIATIVDTILTDEAKTASEIAAELGVSVQKASALMRKVCERELAVKSDVKVKGKGTQKGYAKA